MFHAYASNPFSFSRHHATMRERIHATSHMSELGAARVVRENTDIDPKADSMLFRKAVRLVMEAARGIKEGRRDPGCDALSDDFVYDGYTVAETVASLAVEQINETMCEALVS